ncbi:hypothetical protein K435DRAFT_790913 [Dendrothele bispora CBS 962.96]|uniref:Uncharacterized protein n=1 Tax=Dendrothele bispora (strain CBS 962.96) TaxID=1314807 RepID=A0A4S8MNI8_DENBC|nr:hypothetical protein K435DRAFT_790913 [Dendrothele bispora CBS 962.96]
MKAGRGRILKRFFDHLERLLIIETIYTRKSMWKWNRKASMVPTILKGMENRGVIFVLFDRSVRLLKELIQMFNLLIRTKTNEIRLFEIFLQDNIVNKTIQYFEGRLGKAIKPVHQMENVHIHVQCRNGLGLLILGVFSPVIVKTDTKAVRIGTTQLGGVGEKGWRIRSLFKIHIFIWVHRWNC